MYYLRVTVALNLRSDLVFVYNDHVRSISLILFEVGIPNLVSECILGWRSVPSPFRSL